MILFDSGPKLVIADDLEDRGDLKDLAP